MAEKKTIELEIKSNLGDAEKSLGSLKSQLRQAQAEVASLSDKFGATSKEAVAAAKNAAILADKIGDAKSLTDAFNPDAKFRALSGALTGVAGGFSVVTGALGAVGAESKDVEQAILKVQSAMAIASGAQAIGESVDQFRQLGAVVRQYTIVQKIVTAGQWLWNAAMTANPIGLLVAGVAALIAGGVALTNYFMSNAEAAKINTASINANKTALNNQSKTADSASKSLQTNSDYQLAMAKASGASTDAIRKLELKLIDEKIAFANSSREIAKNTYHKNLNALASLKASDADEEQIKSQEEITRKSLEEFGKQTKNLNDANAEKGNIIRKQNVEIRQEQTNHNNEIRNKNNAAADKAKEDAIAKAKELEEERQALISSQGEKAREEYEASEKLIKDARKANEDALKTENQIKVEKENADFEAKKLDLLNKGLSIEEIEKEHKRKLAQLDTEYYASEADKGIKSTADAKANADAQKVIAEKLADAKIQNLQRGSAMLGQIADLVGKNTTAGKAAAVAGATIDTYAAAQSAFKNAQLNPISIIGPAYPYISAGLAIAGGLKNVQSILAVKTPSGGGGGSAPSGGGMGSAPAAPSFNVVGASSTNQLAQTIGNQQQQPIKAFVVANDVTTQQSLDRNIVSSASIG
jgi:hypothetical protein